MILRARVARRSSENERLVNVGGRVDRRAKRSYDRPDSPCALSVG
jgi:hypothetical protein